MRIQVISASHPILLPKQNKRLGDGGWGVVFWERRGPGKSCWRHTPWSPELKSWLTVPASSLPATSPQGFTHLPVAGRGGDALPGKPRINLPPPDTLRRPRGKWLCFGFRADEVPREAGLGPDTQPSRPFPVRNYLLVFCGFRWLGRASGRWGGGHSARAARCAFIVRAAGFPRASLGAQSHHRAGLGKPWSSGRVQPALRDPPGARTAAGSG